MGRLRFAEHHRYRAVIVENVVEAYQWEPFHAWLAAMRSLGYAHCIVWLNSMHAHAAGLPAPQSRDRMYVVSWRRGDRVPNLDRWARPHGWCARCDTVVRAVQAFKRTDRPAWPLSRAVRLPLPDATCRAIVEPAVLPAGVAIDCTLRGQRIGDRARPLSPKTIARILAGLRKFAVPMMVPASGTWNESAYPVSDPLRTRTTRETEGLACPPLLVPVEGRDGKAPQPVHDPLRTRTARAENALLFPPFVLRPFTPRVTGMVMRSNGSRGDGGEHCTSPLDALRTITTAGHQSLVTWDPHLLVSYYGNGGSRPVAEPMATLTTRDRHALVSVVDETDVADCLFRMLTPGEIKLGMAFDPGYVLLGTNREQTRLAGNAVTPPAARDLGCAVAEALPGELAAA